jgi:hypothetical protein
MAQQSERISGNGQFSMQSITLAAAIVLLGGCTFACAQGQIILVNTAPANGTGVGIDRRYAQIEPTKLELPATPLDARGHQDLLRTLTADQGFAMRPFPRGKKGIFLAANGKLSPVGEKYVAAVTEQGLSVKPGDRVVLSNLRIDKDRLIFDINGGPDRKHDFLRHIEVGMGGGPNMTSPVVQDPGQEPVGARLTLTFAKFVPELTPAQVKSLLAPLISFEMKTPVQAYTDTLPPRIKDAILNHHVMVGMSTDMVLFALGQPENKSREIEGQMPFEEWIYGHAPQEVQFVRINGNRVIRVELARVGQPLEVFTKNEVEGLMTTDGKPVVAALQETHTIELGDTHRDPDRQAPAAPPTLRKEGEKLPTDDENAKQDAINRTGTMKPVVFPKDTTKDPARTVPAHPAPPPPDDASAGAAKPDGTKPDASKSSTPDAPKSDESKPDAPPASKPTAPQTFVTPLVPSEN